MPAPTVCLRVRGQLSVMEYQVKGGERSRCNILVKEEYTVASSWSKVVSVKLEGWWGKVLWLRENGRLLCVTRDGGFVSYDPKRKCIIRMLGRSWPQRFYVGVYTQSLVLLDKESGSISYAKTNNSNEKENSVSTLAPSRQEVRRKVERLSHPRRGEVIEAQHEVQCDLGTT